MNYTDKYFKDRNFEQRFINDVRAWAKDFGTDVSICFLGCGLGHRAFAAFVEGFDDVTGIDLEWPIKHSTYGDKINLYVADISKDDIFSLVNRKYDIVVAYDVLEHMLSHDAVNFAIDNTHKICKEYFIVSVPWIGNPNLNRDHTHIIKETHEWWLNKLDEHGWRIFTTPSHWPYCEQIILCRHKDKLKEITL